MTTEEATSVLQDMYDRIPNMISSVGKGFAEEGSTITLTWKFKSFEKVKQDLKVSGSSDGTFRLFTEMSSKSIKLAGFSLSGASQKFGIELNDGKLSGFSFQEADFLGWNVRRKSNTESGLENDLDIAIKFGIKDISITYRLDLAKVEMPPTVRNNGYSMSYMQNRVAASRVYRSQRSVSATEFLSIPRTKPILTNVDDLIVMPDYIIHKVDAVRYDINKPVLDE